MYVFGGLHMVYSSIKTLLCRFVYAMFGATTAQSITLKITPGQAHWAHTCARAPIRCIARFVYVSSAFNSGFAEVCRYVEFMYILCTYLCTILQYRHLSNII